LEVPVCFAQTIEQVYGLQFKGIQGTLLSCIFYRDTTQVTDDGFRYLRIRFENEDSMRVIVRNSPVMEVFKWTTDDCFLYWSTTVVLPANAGKFDALVFLISDRILMNFLKNNLLCVV
jgi:hypothetical protein